MIIESDNSAMSALVGLKKDEVVNLYTDLKLPNLLQSEDDFMSPEEYSYIFRTLFNATYLRRTYSELALKLLTYTKFDEGLVKGTDTGVTVSHKFGEHTVLNGDTVTERQLHDCGIIYYPQKPYFLCVMTKGKDFEKLSKIISDLSGIVYQFYKNN